MVDLRRGDATEIVGRLTGPFDAMFFDAGCISAPAQLKILMPKPEEDVLFFADNALSHPQEISIYLEAIREPSRFLRR